jgi:hypothetical protein
MRTPDEAARYIHDITQEMISEALTCAKDNGYDVSDWTPEDIALDLIAYEYECGVTTVEELLPYVSTWKATQ